MANEQGSAKVADEVISLDATINVLWRNKFLLVTSMVLFALLGAIYAYVVATPVYQATTVVTLNNREEQVVDLGGVIGGLGSDVSAINTELQVLRSRSLMKKVVNELDLLQDPEFNPFLTDPSRITKLKNIIKSWIGFTRQTRARTAEEEEALKFETAVDILLSKITVRNVPQSLVFQITVESLAPGKAAIIANTLAELYILNQIEIKFDATQQATAWLTERVATLQADLEATENKVKTFRASTELISPEGLSALEIQLKSTRERITAMQADREAALRQLADMQAATTPEQKVSVTNDPALRQLLSQIEEPTVLRRFEQRFEQLLSRAQTDVDQANAQIASLEQAEQNTSRQYDKQSQDLIALQQLTREAEAARLLYEYFLSRLKETSAQQGIQQADSRLLSAAVRPLMPSAPRKGVISAFSGFMGLLLAIFLVLLREWRLKGFRTREALEQATGYQVLGEVPTVPKRQRRKVMDYLIHEKASPAVEAVRNLRTSIQLTDIDSSHNIIMMTSSTPGEGKTTLSIALATSFAQLGRKVLLLEGDMRRRVLGQYFDGSNVGGYLDTVTHNNPIEDYVFTHEEWGVDVLLSGKSSSISTDIFSSQRFQRLLSDLREHYDHIIIDTPPVLLVPDARLIAKYADFRILIVKWESSPAINVYAALRELATSGKVVNGLVLNQIDTRKMRRYSDYGSYSQYRNVYYDAE